MLANNNHNQNSHDQFYYNNDGALTNQYYYDPLPPVETPYLETSGVDAAFSPSYSAAAPAASPEDTPVSCYLAFNSVHSPVMDGPAQAASLSQISNMLSKGDPYEWLENYLDPVFQFDGNPLRLVLSNVTPPSSSVPQSQDYSEEAKCAAPHTPAYDYRSFSWQQEEHFCAHDSEEEEEQLFPPLPSQESVKRSREEDDEEYIPPVKRTRAVSAASVKKNKVTEDEQSRPYQCPTCHARFNRSYNLRTHQMTHDKSRPKPFTCHLCEKGFARKHDRDRHVSAVHANERLFSCHLCHASFARKTYLTSHVSTNHRY